MGDGSDIRFIENDWAPTLRVALGQGKHIRLMVPFIRHKCIQQLFEGVEPKSIQLITRFALSDFYSGVSDLDALTHLLDKGAEIKGIQNLHSKLYIFGGDQAVIGSANLTEAAFHRNKEFGVALSLPEQVAECAKYFDSMWADAGPVLTREQIITWREELAAYKKDHGAPSKIKLNDYGRNLIGRPQGPFFGKPAEDYPQYVVKFFALSTDRWSIGTSVREAVVDSGCYWACTYPEKLRPRNIQDGALVFMAFLTDDGDIRIFGQGLAQSYRDLVDDATPEDIQDRGWKAKWPRYIRVRNTHFFDGILGQGVSLKELRAVHGVFSFTRTAERFAAGEENINPANSIRQKPDVKLTPEAAAWLMAQLDSLYAKHGVINGVELQRERKTTQSGYLNRNDQLVLRRTDLPGNGSGQYIYLMECLKCGHLYGANGADIHERKCPECGNGALGLMWK